MRNILVMLLLLGLFACGQESNTTEVNSPEDIKASGAVSNSELTSNPATANEPLNPDEAAQIQFEEESVDLGIVKEGEKGEHIYKFTNVGKQPLIIQNAKGSCGCTVPEFPREPIPVGGSGQIRVTFDSKGRKGNQEKIVTVTANTIPAETKVRFTAQVVE